MEIPSLGCGERTTLVVPGAGATRGAQFAEAARIGPPLDRDFFRVLQMSSTGRSEAGARLLDHVLEVLVVEPNPSVQSSHIDLFTRRAPAVKVFAFSSLLELSEALAE